MLRTRLLYFHQIGSEAKVVVQDTWRLVARVHIHRVKVARLQVVGTWTL